MAYPIDQIGRVANLYWVDKYDYGGAFVLVCSSSQCAGYCKLIFEIDGWFV